MPFKTLHSENYVLQGLVLQFFSGNISQRGFPEVSLHQFTLMTIHRCLALNDKNLEINMEKNLNDSQQIIKQNFKAKKSMETVTVTTDFEIYILANN